MPSPAPAARRSLALPALAATLLLAIASACGSTRPTAAASPNPTAGTVDATAPPLTTPPGSAPVARARWTALAPSPVPNQTGFLDIWTGTELLVCCGAPNQVPDPSVPAPPAAAAFNPSTNTWRPIQPPPVAVQSWGSVTVVDGTVYLLDGGTQPWAYEAYDIASDAWHPVPAPPGDATRSPDSHLGPSTWSGHEIISVLTTNPSSDHDLALLAFDPSTNIWRTLPPPPQRLEPTSLTIDGTTLTLLGEQRRAGDQQVDGVSLTLDTTTGQWQPAQRTGLDRRDPGAIGGGGHVVAWDVTGHVRVQDDGQWHDEPTIPFPEDECGWRGAQVRQQVVLWRCTQDGAVLDTETGTWSTLPAPPTDLLGDNLVSLGDQVVLWARSTDQLQPYRLDLG